VNIDEVYKQFAGEVKELIPFDRIAVNVLGPEEDAITVAYVFGEDIGGRKKGEVFSMAGTIMQELRRTRSTLLISAGDPKEIQAVFILLYPLFSRVIKKMRSSRSALSEH